jgi:predicted membrane-bound spermidine synthase
MSGGRTAAVAGTAARIPFPVCLGLLAFLSLLAGTAMTTRRPFLLAVGVLGASGISLEVVILFAVQNLRGYIYEGYALLAALFMAGLALGGGAALRRMRARPADSPGIAMMRLSAATAALALLLPFLLDLLSGRWGERMPIGAIAGILLAGLGALLGAAYPFAGRALADMGIGRAAAGIDAADHLGALVGALLFGAFLLPLYGVSRACLLIGLANAAAGGLLLISNRRRG